MITSRSQLGELVDKNKICECLYLSNICTEINGRIIKEKWLPVPKWENLYFVSNIGRILSIEKIVYQPQRNKYAIRSRRILKQKKTNRGYLTVVLQYNKIRNEYPVHRLVCLAFYGNSHKEFVNHKDGNKYNNYFENLEWVTAQENCIHAIENKLARSPVGENNVKAILTEKQVVEIREKVFKGKHGIMTKLASEYRVKPKTIWKIIKRQSWKHL